MTDTKELEKCYVLKIDVMADSYGMDLSAGSKNTFTAKILFSLSTPGLVPPNFQITAGQDLVLKERFMKTHIFR